MLCCVCLLDVHSAMAVSDDMGKQLNIAEIVSKHFWLKQDDIVASNICSICWGKIDDFHGFYETIEKSHKEYQTVQALASIKKEDSNFCSDSIKQEDIGEGDHMSVDKEVQLEIEININLSDCEKNPLAENEQSGDSDDNNDIDYCEKDRKDSISSDEYQPNKSNKKGKTNINAKNPNIKNKPTKCRRKKPAPIRQENKLEPKRKKAAFNRLDPLYTEEMIKKHIPMGCNLCVFVGETFGDIVAHFKADHPNVRPYITCCDKTFTKRFYVAQHAMTHENPVCFSCELCNKSFTTTGGLQKHNLKYHVPEEDRTFACVLCPEKFARQHLLQLHKPSHIPREEWNFFCNKCPTSKAFASAYLLNIHDNKLHKREKNICNVCAKEIKDKKSFEKHVREHTEGSGPRLKCPIPNCDSWLKDEDNLKVHLRRHNTDDETYQCPLCDKICPNRRALASHKVYVHTKEVFKCEHCDKTFKRAITLREHMTQHTGEVLYNCPFCARTFNSNANMHSHKKKQHPVEWEALRIKKLGINRSDEIINMNKIF